jgi:glycopeptide antibiotics resistance protein
MGSLTAPRPHALPAPRRRHFLLLACAWTIFAAYGSLVPLAYQPVAFGDALAQFRQLPPIGVGSGSRADWATNILLFVPLTFLWMGAVSCDRSRLTRFTCGIVLVPLASAASVAIEFAQIWFAGRTTSLNDIAAESIGGGLGVLLWMVLGPRAVVWLRLYSSDRRPRSTVRWLLEAYLLGFAIFSVIPLDLTISLTDLYDKYRSGAVMLVPFSYGYESPVMVVYQFFADIATFVPVGAWLILARPTVLPAYWSPGIVGLIGGAGLGAWLMTRADRGAAHPAMPITSEPRRAGTWPWLAALMAYSIFLIIGFWYPFEWTHSRELIRVRYEGFFRLPFLALYEGMEFNALKQILVRLLLFAPLGVIAAYLAGQARSPVARFALSVLGLTYAAAFATGLEVAQILMPSKVADSTEVGLCFVGAVAGFLVTRRLVKPPTPAPEIGPTVTNTAAAVNPAERSSGEVAVPSAGRSRRPPRR